MRTEAVQGWIEEDELPVWAGLKVIDKSDPDYGLTLDEVMDRNEFIRWYILKTMEPLSLIPKPDHDMDFFVEGFEESAFNTMDYYRIHPNPFNKHAYAIRKVMERARDLAILHSCISDEVGRERTKKRFESFIRYEFGERLEEMSKRLEWAGPVKAEAIRRKISELKGRVIQCRKIWEQLAPRDT